MSQTVITQAFEELKAQEAANGGVLTLDEFVFASVPELNITDPIDRTEGLPSAEQIVHRQAVSKTGMVNSNAVVYSVVLGADVGDFEFNWVGLLNKASGVVAMIVHAPSQKKIRTQSGRQGNVLTRSFLMEYNGASQQTEIITPADTWQIDFTARLNGVDERIRLENLDAYGAASFLNDGFLVSGANGNYLVKKGVAYIEGLRAELQFDQPMTAASWPNKIWVDVCWRGTLTSVWSTATRLTVADNLDNYVVGDEEHYVFAIAGIQADGSVTDLRQASVMAQLTGLSAEANVVPYFDNDAKLKKSALSDFIRGLLAIPDEAGVVKKLGFSDPAHGDRLITILQDLAKAVPRTQHDKNAEVVSVRDFGVLGKGADETVKLQNAIDAVAAAGGGTLLIPAGMTIKCSDRLFGRKGVSIKCDPTSWLDFRGAGWLTPNNNMALLGYYGTAGAFITPTADMVVGSNKVNVPDASLFKVGDMIELSMDDNGKWNDTSVVVTAGQLAIVTGVYPGTNNIVLSEPLYETLTLTKSARIRIIDPVENIIIDGLGIIGNGRNPAGNAEQGLKFFFGRNVLIKNCRMKDVDTQAIGLVSCYGGIVEKSNIAHQPLATIDVISYAIVYASSMHIEIHSNHGVNARHGVISSHLAKIYGYYGINRFINIHNNTHTSNFGDLASSGFVRAHAGFATHTDAEYVSVCENTSIGCRYGINIRTPNNSVKNNKIHDCPVGMYFSEYWGNIEVAYNDFYDCPNPIMTDTVPYEISRGVVNIHDNNFARCGGSAMQFPVGYKSSLFYDRNTVRQPMNTGITATFSAYNNVDLTASGNNIEVNDSFAFRAAGTGMQKILGNNIKYLEQAVSAAVNIVSATNFVLMNNIVEVPEGSTGGNLACPSRIVAPNSIVSNNFRIEV